MDTILFRTSFNFLFTEQTPIRFDFSNPQETCRRYDAAEREAARRNVCSSQMDNAMKAKNAVEMKIAAVQRKIQATDNKLHSPGVPASIRQELKEQIRMLDLDIQRHREEEAKIDDVISRLPGPRPQDAGKNKCQNMLQAQYFPNLRAWNSLFFALYRVSHHEPQQLACAIKVTVDTMRR